MNKPTKPIPTPVPKFLSEAQERAYRETHDSPNTGLVKSQEGDFGSNWAGSGQGVEAGRDQIIKRVVSERLGVYLSGSSSAPRAGLLRHFQHVAASTSRAWRFGHRAAWHF